MYAIRPREHASLIANLPTLEERQAALELVPDEYVSMVKTHLCLIFMLRRAARLKEQSNRSRKAWGK